VVRTPAHVALAREIGSASTVLLKTNTTGGASSISRGLPVDIASIKSIAVIGQDAQTPNRACGDLNECNDGTMSIGYF
jgi:beta-glucosidase